MPRSARISAGRRGTTWPAPLYGRIADAREAPAPTPEPRRVCRPPCLARGMPPGPRQPHSAPTATGRVGIQQLVLDRVIYHLGEHVEHHVDRTGGEALADQCLSKVIDTPRVKRRRFKITQVADHIGEAPLVIGLGIRCQLALAPLPPAIRRHAHLLSGVEFVFERRSSGRRFPGSALDLLQDRVQLDTCPCLAPTLIISPECDPPLASERAHSRAVGHRLAITPGMTLDRSAARPWHDGDPISHLLTNPSRHLGLRRYVRSLGGARPEHGPVGSGVITPPGASKGLRGHA